VFGLKDVLFVLMIFPVELNNLSLGAVVAGMDKNFLATSLNFGKREALNFHH
jgi:hypothetical protein